MSITQPQDYQSGLGMRGSPCQASAPLIGQLSGILLSWSVLLSLSLALIAAVYSKDRSYYDKKMEADTKTIERLCTEYNGLLVYGTPSLQRPKAVVEQCKAADFPWADEVREGIAPSLFCWVGAGSKSIPVYNKLYLCVSAQRRQVSTGHVHHADVLWLMQRTHCWSEQVCIMGHMRH